MKIEHFAYQVNAPFAVADWYTKNLGFTIKRSSESPVPVCFLADSAGDVMLEIYNNPAVVTPDYASMDPLLLHLAFVCAGVPEKAKELTAAGATLLSGPETTPGGDELAMLRDPWGLAIQLCQRAEPML